MTVGLVASTHNSTRLENSGILRHLCYSSLQPNSLSPSHPLFFLELGVPSRGMLSKHTNKLFLSAQTLLGWGRVRSCTSHQKAVFHGPFVDLPPACFHFTSGAKTRAKMEFHFQMRFHKTFYQICRPITLAGFSPPCSGSFYPSPPHFPS